MKPPSDLQPLATRLRTNSTDAERLLWKYLRDSQIEGVQFRRQQVIEKYIVDFVAFAHKLVIEVDGGQHADNALYDQRRDEYLQANGFTVLRFWDCDVMKNIEGVVEVIRLYCLRSASPTT
ncbi:DUF559 domain-containing protein [Geomonas sp. RF6]|uniref:endonuclease domain-containing protein n=1 Tax=Geomonas sp. RF6 TaxID=2897342 RepID=UPI001E3A70D1|nr:DUF559 domain-containing protein [Geomonas sp. RF6]UFS70785.1 DUF559 domain-containing protein [Geomonas sp. RF6]